MNPNVRGQESLNVTLDKTTKYSGLFLNIGSICAGVSYLCLWIGTFYLKIPMDSVIGFGWNDGSADGKCPSAIQGIGRHCFSDYYTPSLAFKMINPWESGYAYTPLAAQLFYPFYLIGQIFNYPRLGLIVYLAIGLLCVLAPTIWASRQNQKFSFPVLLIVGVLATPLINSFDRGSLVMFITPLLFAYALNICRQNWGIAVVAASVLGGIKPQFMVLLLPLLVHRQWVHLQKGLRWGIGLNILGFISFTDDPIKVFNQWLKFAIGYNVPEKFYGSNRANVSPINLISKVFNLPISSINKLLDTNLHLGAFSTLVVVTFAIVLPLFIIGKKSDLFGLTVISLVMSSIFIPTSNYYYQVFAVAVAALIIRTPLKFTSQTGGVLDEVNFVSRFGPLTKWSVLMATANSCFNLAISDNVLPFRENNLLAPGNISRVLVGPVWVFVIICIVVDSVSTFRKLGVE